MEKKLNKKEKFFIVLVLGVITIFSIVINTIQCIYET